MKIKIKNWIEISATQSPFISFAIGILILAFSVILIAISIKIVLKA